MNILIIGSKGFIGSHALSHFNKGGHVAYGCDVGVDYNDQQYFQVDATNADYDEIFEAVKFDACINCSGAASVPDSMVHPYRDFYLNTNNVFKLLESIRKYNAQCKYLNLSSAAIYGNPVKLPVVENAVLKPVSPYGHHKWYAEMIGQEFYSYFQIPTCSVRIFSAYGPGLRKQLFWDLFKKSTDGSEITLFGTGKESRDFIFIDDIVQGIETVLMNGAFDGRGYNLASGKQITIREATTTFFDIWDKQIQFKFQMTNRTGDPLNWQADISAIEALGFSPQVSLQKGIQKYVQWLKETA